MNSNLKYLCIFGGGAVRGFSYLGAYRALVECEIDTVALAGSSVGAVFSAFWAVGIPPRQIEKFFLDVNFELFKDINFLSGPEFAISKGGVFLDWLRENIELYHYKENFKKGKNPPVTFKDIDKELIIIASDLTNCKPFVFSKKTTPDFEIAMAVKISSSMPGLLKPQEHNGMLLCDGDLMKSIPLWRLCDCIDQNDVRVLEFRLEGIRQNNEIKSTPEYFNTVYSCMTNYATDFIMEIYSQKDKFDYIKIDTKDLLLVNFNISIAQREELIRIGYNSTKEFFTKILPQKKKALSLEYKKLLNILENVKIKLVKNRISKAEFEFLKIFPVLCEAKKVIDTIFYDEIMTLHELFYKNLHTNLLNKKILNNKNLVTTYLLLLIHKLENKCKELDSYECIPINMV